MDGFPRSSALSFKTPSAAARTRHRRLAAVVAPTTSTRKRLMRFPGCARI
jgi:hypothetical protein